MSWFKKNKQEVYFNTLEADEQEELLEFVGKRKNYFKKVWDKLSKREVPLSLNLPSLFLGLFWFAYRKMHLLTYSIMGAIAAIELIIIFIYKNTSSSITYGGAFVGLSLAANTAYFRYSIKRINKIKENYPDINQRKEMIEKIGGVSWLSVLAFLIVSIIYSYSIYAVEEKVYYSYAEPKFEEALELQNSGELNKALTIYDDIKNNDFPIPAIYYNSAMIYLTKENYDKALENINKFLSYVPDDKEALNLKEHINKKIQTDGY